MNDTADKSFDTRSFLASLTHRPGVYRMLNAKSKIIYVGKASDLKKRVSSYFSRSHSDAKTASMMTQVARVEVTVTNTEAEALILEYNLIKKHKPRFNVVLRDDKSYHRQSDLGSRPAPVSWLRRLRHRHRPPRQSGKPSTNCRNCS